MSHKPLVLIVEDSPSVALDMRLALEEAGYRVLGPVASHERAMELIDAFQFDVVLLDIDLPGPKRGLAVAGELLKRRIPTVFVSAVTPNDPEARQSEVRALSKLVDAQRLIDSVELVQATPTDLPSALDRYNWHAERRNRKDV